MMRWGWLGMCVLLATAAAAVEIHVAPDGSGDAATIQAALAMAGDLDEVVLADGVFIGPGNHSFDLDARNVILRSASGDPSLCIIDLDGHHGFVQEHEFHLALDGVTMRNGSHALGGAVACAGAGVTITRCVFENNGGAEAGAVYASRSGFVARNEIEDCIFTSNRGAAAAALWLNGFVNIVSRCSFLANTSLGDNANVVEIYTYGASFYDCEFRENVADWCIVNPGGSQNRFVRCLFADNRTSEYGAVYVWFTSVWFENCTFVGNTGDATSDILAGGGPDDDITIRRCVFAYGEALDAINGEATLSESVLYTAGRGWHWTIADQLGQDGNVDLPPVFCDRAAGDYHVADISPCLPANSAYGNLIGALDQGCQLADWTVHADGQGLLEDIQSAIDLAPAGGVIRLGDGEFTGPRNRDLDLGGKSLTLQSLSGPDQCVIACDTAPGDEARAFWFHSGEDSLAQVVGVTIRGGRSATAGGAVVCEGAGPAFRDCRFLDCDGGSYGGAVDCHAGAAPLLDGCLFAGNRAVIGGAVTAREGATPLLRRCTVAANDGQVASVVAWDADIRLDRTIVAFDLGAAAVGLVGQSTAALTDCDLFGNAGGDWTAAVADQLGQDGNFSEDPCFCDLAGGGYSLCGDSWCLPGFNPTGRDVLVGAFTAGCEVCGCATSTGVFTDPIRALPNLGRVLVTWTAPGHLAWQFRLEARLAGAAWTVPVVGDAAGFTAADTHARLAAGGRVTYDLFVREDDSWRLVAEAHADVPALDAVALLGASPNPFNPRTEIVLRLGIARRAELAVFDLRGRRVATLWRDRLDAGVHRIAWNGRDDAGRAVATGTYLCRLRVDGVDRSLKLTLAK